IALGGKPAKIGSEADESAGIEPVPRDMGVSSRFESIISPMLFYIPDDSRGRKCYQSSSVSFEIKYNDPDGSICILPTRERAINTFAGYHKYICGRSSETVFSIFE